MSTRSLRYVSPVRSRRLSPLRSRLGSNAARTRGRSPVHVASPTRRATLRRTSPIRRSRAATARKTPTKRVSPTRKTSYRRGKGSNPWVEFIKAHKGQGYTFKELSRMYKGM